MRKLAYDRASFVAALLVTAACGSGSSSSTGAQANGDSGGGFDSAVADAPFADTATATNDGGAAMEAGAPEASPPDGDGDAGAWPLGSSFDPTSQRFHFRVRSATATAMEVDLFAAALDASAKLTAPLTQDGSADSWSASVSLADVTAAGITGTVYYGYRAWGPNWPVAPGYVPGTMAGFLGDVDDAGNRFNPNKLLIDPYTREISHDPLSPGHTDDSLYAVGSANRAKDSAPEASKSVVLTGLPGSQAPDVGTKPARALADDVIYEVHVRGLTENDPQTTSCAGTYAAAGAKAAYLESLGVTAIELLPIEETQNDTNDLASAAMTTNGDNYWGYSTLADFAPDRRYACDQSIGGPTREFAAMVKAFHDQGIKVFLDVVYNHTAEGGDSSLLSWRGLDNASYYELDATGAGYNDDTGIGANYNIANPIARDLVLDSLTYWSTELGVDGFRFDLAAVLGNTCETSCYAFAGSMPGDFLAMAVAALPGEALIAEPWGVAAGTYQLGNFPQGWSEWNGQFRDTIRTAQNLLGVTPTTPESLVDYLGGSPSLFSAARGPTASINYLDCHDGFTLHDLYSCDAPNNAQAWPYGPSSAGTTQNYSWDQGGDAGAQEQAERTGLAILATAAGVPMIAGGDEIGRTIQCNNNPYDVDSLANWPAEDSGLLGFTSSLFAFRGAHVVLRPRTFRTGTDHNGNGVADVTWLDATGAVANAAYLADASNSFLAFRLDGTEALDSASSIYVAYNASYMTQAVTLPAPLASWHVAADTGAVLATGSYVAPSGSEPAYAGPTYMMTGRSVAIFLDR